MSFFMLLPVKSPAALLEQQHCDVGTVITFPI